MENVKPVLISLITVCLNAAQTIETTIKSVVNQSYKNIEYIVVDGGSADGTRQILERYRKHISVVVSEKDEGIYDAMNKGIALAHGEYIGIINADDWYEEDAVETVVQIRRNVPGDVGVISGPVRFVDGEQSFVVRPKEMDQIWTEMPISHPGTFIRKSVYEKYGNYDIHYKIAADYDLIFRLYVNGVKFLCCDKILANFRAGGVSGTKKDILFREDVEILGKYIKYSDDLKTVRESIRRKESIRLFYQADKEIFYKALGIAERQDVFIFGCGYWGREFAKQMDRRNIVVKGFLDNNCALWGTEIAGCAIDAPNMLQNQLAPKVIIAIQGETAAVEEQLLALNERTSCMNLENIFSRIYDICEGDKR